MLPQSQQLCNVFQRYLDTGYGTQVWYTATTRAAGQSDYLWYAPPGPKARTAYATVLRQPDTEASSALTRPADKHQEKLVVLVTQGTPLVLPPSPSRPMHPCADSETAPPETTSATGSGTAPTGPSGHTSEPTAPPPAQAVALVQQFYERFHGLPGVMPTAKELAWAITLLSQHGPTRARFLLTYAREAATATDYHPQTFMGILHYLPRALAAFAMRTTQAAARQAEAAERTQHEQYTQWRQQTLAQLRATRPETELAALAAVAQARLLAEGTAACALPLAVRLAVDAVLEAQAGLPDFAAWQQAHPPHDEGGQ